MPNCAGWTRGFVQKLCSLIAGQLLVEEGLGSIRSRSHPGHLHTSPIADTAASPIQLLRRYSWGFADTAASPIQPLPRYSCFADAAPLLIPLRRCSRFADTSALPIQLLRQFSSFADTDTSPIQPLFLYSSFADTAALPIQPLRSTLTSTPQQHSVNHAAASATAGPPCASPPCLLSRPAAPRCLLLFPLVVAGSAKELYLRSGWIGEAAGSAKRLYRRSCWIGEAAVTALLHGAPSSTECYAG